MWEGDDGREGGRVMWESDVEKEDTFFLFLFFLVLFLFLSNVKMLKK